MSSDYSSDLVGRIFGNPGYRFLILGTTFDDEKGLCIQNLVLKPWNNKYKLGDFYNYKIHSFIKSELLPNCKLILCCGSGQSYLEPPDHRYVICYNCRN